jgi:hypothetical protein
LPSSKDIVVDLLLTTFITHNMDVSISLLVAPVVIYSNAELQKASILTENKGKSGIYC